MNLKMNGYVWAGAIAVFVVLVIVFAIVIPMSAENSFLVHSNPTKQKLMVVDQDTGAISFVTKSLQGINNDFTAEDAKVRDALKILLGDNLDNFAGLDTSSGRSGLNGVLQIMQNSAATALALSDTFAVHEKRLNVLSCGTETCTGGRVEKSPGDPNTYVKRGSYFNLFSKTDDKKSKTEWTLPSLVRFSNEVVKDTYMVSLEGTANDTDKMTREDALWKIL